jgi:cytochrome c1
MRSSSSYAFLFASSCSACASAKSLFFSRANTAAALIGFFFPLAPFPAGSAFASG